MEHKTSRDVISHQVTKIVFLCLHNSSSHCVFEPNGNDGHDIHKKTMHTTSVYAKSALRLID